MSGATASLEKIEQANDALVDAKFSPQQVACLKKHGPSIGWRNLMHMLCYGTTPEEIKEGKKKK